jgi:hypothetical protein
LSTFRLESTLIVLKTLDERALDADHGEAVVDRIVHVLFAANDLGDELLHFGHEVEGIG